MGRLGPSKQKKDRPDREFEEGREPTRYCKRPSTWSIAGGRSSTKDRVLHNQRGKEEPRCRENKREMSALLSKRRYFFLGEDDALEVQGEGRKR